ncbi:hypothetical protein LZP96_16135 [Enterobacteriaceae bacterium 155047]|uniref:DUF7079 family protein n=1 Tax=Huaxiibacter chinensis TaxID=2899785 RepID=UPI0007DAACB7|nr:hypothetical protein [Huaxiibacter chinensis]ANG94129.1 hypothetical protein A8A57_17660 [Lelliottia amnigena]MCG5045553.1 hypothetical protein [Huaxiibacter chinensis]
MKYKLAYYNLYGALSEIYVDNEVGFICISSIAKNSPVTIVEELLFEWVAPFCYTDLMTPAPSVWSGFDKKALWIDICDCRNKKGFAEKCKHKLLVSILKKTYRKEWLALKNEILQR